MPGLTITPNVIDVTTVPILRAWLSTQKDSTVPSSEDSVLQFAITSFSRFLLTLIGTGSLNSLVNYSETYDGNNHDELFLRNFPITAVQLLQINAQMVQPSAQFGQAGYYISSTGRALRIRGGMAGDTISSYYPTSFNLPYVFVKGRGNILVNYTAGFPPNVIINEPYTVAAGDGPFVVTVNNAPWQSDQGVSYAAGGAFTKVVGVPVAAGQYSVANGMYTFNSADKGVAVLISYTAGQPAEDIQLAATQVLAETYRKRNWIGLKQRALTGAAAGTTTYRDWEMPPECVHVFNSYRRYTM